MAEARYRGQKVVVVSPDYADNVEVRRRVAARPAGHRRRAGDGDGPRDPPGVLRRPAGAAVRRLRQALHRPAVPGHADRGADGALRAGQVPHRRRPRRRPATEARVQDRAAWTRPPARPSVPNGSLGHRFAEPGGQVEPRPRRRRPAAVAVRRAGERGRGAPAALRLPTTTAGLLRRGVPVRRVGGPAGHHRLRPDAGPVRRGPPGPARAAGRPATTTPIEPYTPGLAGADHRRAGRGGGPDRPGVRRQRRAVRRPVDDPHGRGHQPLVPLRHHLPGDPGADHADRLPGRQRRRLGALRRPGEVPPGDRLGAAGVRRWTGRARRGR